MNKKFRSGNLLNENLGLVIRELRINKDMTLNELSNLTNLSISYLSLLERGKSNPTISNINRICNALNITMSHLFTNVATNDDIIVKKENRKMLFHSNTDVTYEALTNNKPLSGICMIVRNNNLNISNPHNVDEFGYLISGSLIINICGTDYTINPGDSIYIPANSHHSFQKISAEESISIWTYAPNKQ